VSGSIEHPASMSGVGRVLHPSPSRDLLGLEQPTAKELAHLELETATLPIAFLGWGEADYEPDVPQAFGGGHLT
jgi:hypothetical protein